MFVRLGFRKKVELTKKKSKHTGKYETPTTLGAKWQMDVKYVPKVCHAGKDGKKFYQSNRRCDALPASFVPFLRFEPRRAFAYPILLIFWSFCRFRIIDQTTRKHKKAGIKAKKHK